MVFLYGQPLAIMALIITKLAIQSYPKAGPPYLVINACDYLAAVLSAVCRACNLVITYRAASPILPTIGYFLFAFCPSSNASRSLSPVLPWRLSAAKYGQSAPYSFQLIWRNTVKAAKTGSVGRERFSPLFATGGSMRQVPMLSDIYGTERVN